MNGEFHNTCFSEWGIPSDIWSLWCGTGWGGNTSPPNLNSGPCSENPNSSALRFCLVRATAHTLGFRSFFSFLPFLPGPLLTHHSFFATMFAGSRYNRRQFGDYRPWFQRSRRNRTRELYVEQYSVKGHNGFRDYYRVHYEHNGTKNIIDMQPSEFWYYRGLGNGAKYLQSKHGTRGMSPSGGISKSYFNPTSHPRLYSHKRNQSRYKSRKHLVDYANDALALRQQIKDTPYVGQLANAAESYLVSAFLNLLRGRA